MAAPAIPSAPVAELLAKIPVVTNQAYQNELSSESSPETQRVSDSDSQAHCQTAEKLLRSLLEHAGREVLQELARSSVNGATSASVETVVKGVADRLLADGANLPFGPSSCPSASRPDAQEEHALLQDLKSVPWSLSRGDARYIQELFSSSKESRPSLGMKRNPSYYTMMSLCSSHALDETSGSGLPDCIHSDPIPRTSENKSPLGAMTSTYLTIPSDPMQRKPSSSSLAESIPEESMPRTRVPEEFMPQEEFQLFDPPPREQVTSRMKPLWCNDPNGHGAGPETLTMVRNGLRMEAVTAQSCWMWYHEKPKNVLLVAKRGDPEVIEYVKDMAAWLCSQDLVVVVEQQLAQQVPELLNSKIRTFTSKDDLAQRIDIAITLGGDGTLTWTGSLFGGAAPPLISFAAGSLGFLTPFPLQSWVRTLVPLLGANQSLKPVPLVCRMRLHVVVRRARKEVQEVSMNKWCSSSGAEDALKQDRVDDECSVECLCLNEVLCHRGPSGHLTKLDVMVDGEPVTMVQGDGLILATPTGSTAYSLAAGGSMVHPSVPAILLTPVCPHSLSFRPVLLPDSAVVTLCVPNSARNPVYVTVDGKDFCELSWGDSIQVCVSPFPLPTICRTTETKDWFKSVQEALQWNLRAEQKAMFAKSKT